MLYSVRQQQSQAIYISIKTESRFMLMNKYKVCVYAICKNEEKFIDRWMDSVSEADMVIVTDTGSTDGSVEKLRAKGAIVYCETIDPWRFDTARNIAMDHIPEDVDICVSNDIDEVFEKGWREKLESVWEPTHTRARYLFTWSYHPDGTPNKQFMMEKIHRRKGFRWVHPVHEILQYNGKEPESVVFVPGMVLNHYPDLTKPRSQYLPLLELSAKENPTDDRTAFWLGREYMYYGQYDKCIAELKRHLKLPTAKWAEERSASMRFIAKSYQAKGDLKQAKVWLYRAIAECPDVREPYLYMARLGYLENDWPLVMLMTEKALEIKEKSGSYLLETEAWGYELYDLAAISYYRLGLYEKSHNYVVMACTMKPDDLRLKRNLKLIDLKYKKEAGLDHEKI
jgi:tetratricopeptide (TPR) repeat protein